MKCARAWLREANGRKTTDEWSVVKQPSNGAAGGRAAGTSLPVACTTGCDKGQFIRMCGLLHAFMSLQRYPTTKFRHLPGDHILTLTCARSLLRSHTPLCALPTARVSLAIMFAKRLTVSRIMRSHVFLRARYICTCLFALRPLQECLRGDWLLAGLCDLSMLIANIGYFLSWKYSHYSRAPPTPFFSLPLFPSLLPNPQ